MGTRVFDQTVFIADDDTIGTTSSDYHSLTITGDTLRLVSARTPANASATGEPGEICWDASYIYVCTATNTWKRSALSSW